MDSRERTLREFLRVLVDRRGYWLAVECGFCGERLHKRHAVGMPCGGCGTVPLTRKYRSV